MYQDSGDDIININCINKCLYQTNGKCTLTYLPKINYFNISEQQNNCPYKKAMISTKLTENNEN